MRLPTSGPNAVPLPPISTEASSETEKENTKESLLMKPF